MTKIKILTLLLIVLNLSGTNAHSNELTIEQTYKTKGLKAVEEIMMTEISRRTNVFYKKVEMCNSESLDVALKIYAETVNASVLPGLDENLHNALMVCPEKILEGINYAQIPAVCGAYSDFIENIVVKNKKKISSHYVKIKESLKKIKKSELSERVAFCIKSLHSEN